MASTSGGMVEGCVSVLVSAGAGMFTAILAVGCICDLVSFFGLAWSGGPGGLVGSMLRSCDYVAVVATDVIYLPVVMTIVYVVEVRIVVGALSSWSEWFSRCDYLDVLLRMRAVDYEVVVVMVLISGDWTRSMAGC